LGGRVVRKNQTDKIDGEKFPAVDIVAAEKAGFIEKIKSSEKQPAKKQEQKTEKKVENKTESKSK